MDYALAYNLNRMARLGVGGLGGTLREAVISALFGAGEQGFYLSKDVSYFTDTGLTVRSNQGEVVKGVKDQAENGFDFIQSDVAKSGLHTSNGLLLDGVDDHYLGVGDPFGLVSDSNTIVTVIRFDGGSAIPNIIRSNELSSGAGSTAAGVGLFVNSNDQARFAVWLSGGVDFIDASTAFTNGTFYVISARFNRTANTLDLRINGASVASKAVADQDRTAAGSVYLGSAEPSTGFFKGILSETLSVNKFVSDAELTELENNLVQISGVTL